MQLTEIRAIVTGAAGGLGSRFALELARAGARVLAGDTNAAGLRELAGRAEGLTEGLAEGLTKGSPGELAVGKLDVADEAAVAAFFDLADERLGGANVLLNSAGIKRDGLVLAVPAAGGEPATLPLAQWRKVLEVNLTGPFLMTRAFAARLVARGEPAGVVVNLSSLARAGNPGQSSYAASKAGLDACTRTWALELAEHGIRVGGVAPGVTETGFLDGISEPALARLTAAIPLGRRGTAEEVWQAVRFILECDFFTGRTVEVDGGAAMGGLA